MQAILNKNRQLTRPVITPDQARARVWVRATFPDGIAGATQKFLESCTVDQAAALLCMAQLASDSAVYAVHRIGLDMMFTTETIDFARQKYEQDDPIYRLIHLYGTLNKGLTFGIEDDAVTDHHRGIFGDDADDVDNFMAQIEQIAAPYRAAFLDMMRANMAIKPISSSIRLV